MYRNSLFLLFSGLEFVSVPKILVWRDHFVMPLEVQVDVDMEFASMGKKILRMMNSFYE